MKKYLLIALLTFIGFSCAKSYTLKDVKYLGQPNLGAIELTSVGTGGSAESLERDAIKKMLETLLFTGLPATNNAVREPLLGTQAQNSDVILQSIMERGDFKSFILENQPLEKLKITPKGTFAEKYRFVVQYDALRRYLENNNFIRKFGY